MRRALHTQSDRLLMAQVSGAIAKHAALKERFDMDRAIFEVLSITGDPHLLSHAWAYPDPLGFPDPWRDRKNEILLAAGAERPEDAP